MLNSLKGLMLTLASTFTGLRKPVTRQYPTVPTPVQPRFMGFPALTWDQDVEEPFCTGCMVCIRHCPTQCMSASMKDNPLQEEGKSSRKKIVENFESRMERCILCAICVEVCNFEAIAMTDYHEEANLSRGGLVATKEDLFRMGRDYQKRAGIVVGGDSAEESEESEESEE